MPDQRAQAASASSITRTVSIVGERWSLLVLRAAFNGVTRFDELRRLTGCAPNVLTARLAALVEHGVLERRPYRTPGQRTRDEYVLTSKGRDLYPVLIALIQWGDRYEVGEDGVPVQPRHGSCGARVTVTIECERGHHHLTDSDTTFAPPASLPTT